MSTETTGVGRKFGLATLIGPGMMVAATGIGAGDLTAATVGGAGYGLVLIWAIVLGAFFKFVLNEGLARWQLATDKTILEGWAEYLPGWVQVYFGAYLLVWTVAVSVAMANACGLGISNLTGGAIPTSWGAVIHSLLGGALVWFGGFQGFEKLMRALIGIMVIGIVACAVLTFQDFGGTVRGLLIPTVPPGSTTSLLALIGGVGGTITVINYNYWMREEKITGAGSLRYVRIDLLIAYTMTAALAIAVLMMANRAFFTTGVELNSATAVPQMAAMLGATLGPFGSLAYSIGFWGAVASSLLGVWQGVPYMFADIYGIVRKYPSEVRDRLKQTNSTPYRIALIAMTLIPIPFAFLNRPLLLLITYTVIGSLFFPFLAATLLYLNNKVAWDSPVKKNSRITNVLLVMVLVFFAVIAVQDLVNAF